MKGSADLRIVLLGKTGVGRSSTANSILGEKLFKTSCSANSQTGECESRTKTIHGRSITVIDTPGFFDNKNPGEALNGKIVECITECSATPHTFIIVLSIHKQTPEELLVIKRIEDWFGEKALKYVIVLFTHGDQLDDNTTIQEFVEKNGQLKSFVDKCKSQLHVIDNKYWNNPTEGQGGEKSNTAQIKKLLNTIDEIMKENRAENYTNEMHRVVENVKKAQSRGRGKSGQNVMKMFLKTGAGILLFLTAWYAHMTKQTKGALLGATVGAAVYLIYTFMY